MLRRLLMPMLFSAAACTPQPPAPAESAGQPATLPAPATNCATPEQAEKIRTYYTSERPGVPLAVASRAFEVPEAIIASALPPEQSIGVDASPEITGEIWRSIESWGAATNVTLVITPSSQHAFAFPSLVPVNQDDNADGYLDVYADSGNGVHSHIQIKYVSKIFASDITTAEANRRTRGVSFFSSDGHLIIGVYASINKDAFDLAAVTGFDRTWALIGTMPRACQS